MGICVSTLYAYVCVYYISVCMFVCVCDTRACVFLYFFYIFFFFTPRGSCRSILAGIRVDHSFPFGTCIFALYGRLVLPNPAPAFLARSVLSAHKKLGLIKQF